MEEHAPIVVIPARYGASRLPGKALADIHGRPMVVRVLERVRRCSRVGQVVVATDDQRIVDAVTAAGGVAVMTESQHASGTDRIAEALSGLSWSGDVVVNVQGDEPLVSPQTIDALVDAMDDPQIQVATVVAPLRGDPAEASTVKAVVTDSGRALYFSRAPVPHGGPYWHHIGLYAYRAQALEQFIRSPPTPLELVERLEQLRFLELGCPIAVVAVDEASPSVDTPADLELVRRIFQP
jgi:3-deoxy-manno-octulosonate cytidylyltransferase (CMP-KDO synthetase)